jgi:photosystem II stability/assembly factor-like uncharacterized protein
VDGRQPWFFDTEEPGAPFDPARVPEWIRTRKFYQRWLYDYELVNDPRNPISNIMESRLDAWKRLERDRQNRFGGIPLTNRALGGASTRGVPGTTGWIQGGPAPIANWINTQQRVSGQIGDIVVHPSDPNTWLIGTAAGGVWKTNTAGATWIPRTDNQASMSIGAVAFAPGNPNVIYVGTGHYTDLGGVGVLKSADGGNSWSLLASSTFLDMKFHDIRVHPTNENVAVAATSGGIFRTIDGGTNWSPELGNAIVTDLEVDPSNFNRQYAGVQGPNSIDGVYRSFDGGDTWTILSTVPWQQTAGDDVGRVELAIAPSNVNVMYVGITAGASLKGLWRTANAWATTPAWVQIPTQATSAHGDVVSDYCTNQCGYDHEIIVHPGVSTILFAGGVRLFRCNYGSGSCLWTDISRSEFVGGIHADQHTMAWAGTRLIVGNDGGIFSTTDNGTTWTSHNDSLPIIEFYHGSLHPTNSTVMQGGAQDNGSSRRPTSGGWVWNYADLASDGGDNFFANNSPNTRWVLSTGIVEPLTPVRFKEGAQCNVHENIPDKSGRSGQPAIELCPANDDVVLAGANNVWKTTNMFSASCCTPNQMCSPLQPSWTKVCTGDPDGGELGSSIDAIGFAPRQPNCDVFAFGASNGKMRVTISGGTSTCTDLDPSGQVPNGTITDIALHPCFAKDPAKATNTETAYVTLGNIGFGHVYKTTSALSARNWSDVTPEDSSGQPYDIAHKTIVIDPLVPNHVYVGAELGVWWSGDAGGPWQRFEPADGLPYVRTFDLQMNSRTNRVVAFTHGRSVFELPLNRCTGDCDGNRLVSVTELTTISQIVQGALDLCMCPIADANQDGTISGSEQNEALNNWGNGCPA